MGLAFPPTNTHRFAQRRIADGHASVTSRRELYQRKLEVVVREHGGEKRKAANFSLFQRKSSGLGGPRHLRRPSPDGLPDTTGRARRKAWTMTDTEFLTKADVAKQLGITPGAIEKAEREGRIAATTRTRGGVRLYTAENVAAFESLRAAGRRQRKPAKG